MEDAKRRELQILACKIRMGIIEGVYNAKSGHPGGSLSIAELLAYLYGCELRVDPKDPKNPGRDRFILSKGHAAPALYAALALKGYFPLDEIKYLRKPGKMLQGHPDMKGTPGVDMSTGSLGQGVSAACGMALSAKLSNESYRVYTILGDGELEEGQVWEAAMFAGFKKLDNLCAVVDHNGLQIDGAIEQVMSPQPIDKKFTAFNWHVIKINGNSLDEIEKAFAEAKNTHGKPTAIIAQTVKGKGVSYMENQVGWHGTAPNAEQYAKAVEELNRELAVLEA